LTTAVGSLAVKPAPAFVIPVANAAEVGVALVNPEIQETSVILELFAENGQFVTRLTPAELSAFGPKHQRARFLQELGVPSGFRGSVILRPIRGTIVVMGLILKEGLLTTVPVIASE
jgi:hypothetical protein